MGRKVLIVSVCLVACVGLCLHQPVPDGYSRPWQIYGFFAFTKAFLDITMGLDYYASISVYDINAAMINLGGNQAPGDLANLDVQDVYFGGVKIRLYRPKNIHNKLLPGLVFFHGGGWVLGSSFPYDPLMINTSQELNMVIASVDYRLAPKYTFPIGFEDCVNAARHLMSNAETYGVDETRVAIGGDSTGGNLAAAVCLKLRDDGFTPQPKLQILIYPALQGLDFSLPSYVHHGKGPVCTLKFIAWCWTLYIAGDHRHWNIFMKNNHVPAEVKRTFYKKFENSTEHLPSDLSEYISSSTLADGDVEVWDQMKDTIFNPYLSPLLAETVSNIPQTYMFTAGHDILQDEGFLYVQRCWH